MSKSQKKSGKDVNDNLVDTTAQSPGNDTDSDGGEGVVRALEEAAAGELPNHDAGGNASGVQYTAAERDELRAELLKTEEEIATLRNVLESRVRHCAELKRKLGVTPWHEISSDINSGVNYIKQSDAFHMTEEAIKKVNDKSRSLYSTVTQKVSDQVGTVKENDNYKSLENMVGSMYTTVKSTIITPVVYGRAPQDDDAPLAQPAPADKATPTSK